jgi:exodeoxyribonuclease V alpha subunit
MQEGHICIHKNDVERYSNELPYPPPYAIGSFGKMKPMVGTSEDISPFILHKDMLYLHRYFTYETQLLNAIAALLKMEKDLQQQRQQELRLLQPLINKLQARYDPKEICPAAEKIDWQLAAAIQGVLNNFTIITGGPGTGKTTTVAKILTLLFTINPACKVALAAPTGKAAMRMAESLKQTKLEVSDEIKERFSLLNPNTIHRLLKYIPDSVYFRHNHSNPLPYDVVIVDEASMIDVALFAKLLDAVGPHTRLILLGDKNQLASVEAGSMFGDLCKAVEFANPFTQASADFINQFILEKECVITGDFVQHLLHPLAGHIVELQKSHRFKSTGGIGKFSKAIIHNEQEVLHDFIHHNKEAAVQIDTNANQQLFEKFVDGYKDYLQEKETKLALQKFNQLRVLCATREGPQGLYATNRAIEQYLKKHYGLDPRLDFYHNRPIIVTKNYPELKLFNGDIGIIRKDDKGNLRAYFEDSDKEIRSVLPGYIDSAETVFAMTIHKSQGSEYSKVLVLLPQNTGNQLLTRELLYTAVTRAKEKVLVQASEAVLMETTEASVERASGIINRFEEI